MRISDWSSDVCSSDLTAAGYSDKTRRDQREANIALRKLGMAEDVARAILFLASPAAGHISGIDVLVDGGMSNMLMPASGGGTGQTQQRDRKSTRLNSSH